jgi:hypothetical protein
MLCRIGVERIVTTKIRVYIVSLAKIGEAYSLLQLYAGNRPDTHRLATSDNGEAPQTEFASLSEIKNKKFSPSIMQYFYFMYVSYRK